MTEINHIIIYLSISILVFSGIILLVLLIKFSSFLIKLVVVEVITNTLLGAIALLSLLRKQPLLIDACIPLALIMFLGVVAYYQFLYERKKNDINTTR